MPERESPQPISVSQLTLAIKDQLNTSFDNVWVTGEISNLARPRSGHLYLALKDEDAVLSAVVWRGMASRLTFELEDGLEVVCRGAIDVYPPRGSYQLIIREMVPKGVGSLQLAFKQLFERLSREGLFAEERKRPIPALPRTIGFVTSPSGAAIRDFLEVVRRRWRDVRVLVIPAKVQGAMAADEIARGIRWANRLAGNDRPDVLVVGRGGGSLEDLWCFNEEAVVRAIAASDIPTVSAVGHEIDVSLSDLAADLRALTPSEAAERVVPDGNEIRQRLTQVRKGLAHRLQASAAQARSRLESLASRPVLQAPLERIHRLGQDVDQLERRLNLATDHRLDQFRHQLQGLTERLEGVSPLGILSRGYSITTKQESDVPLRSAKELEIGDTIKTRLQHDELLSRIIDRRSVEPLPAKTKPADQPDD